MTDQLGPASRALLDAAREGLTPDPAAIARVRGKLAAATGGAGVASTLASKLGLLAIVATIATGVALHGRRDAIADEPLVVRAPMIESAPTRQTAHEPTVAGRAPIAMPPMDVSSPRPVDGAAARPVRPRSSGISLAREVELVDAAMAAMKRGDAAGALASVHVHAAETAGAGQLAEDAAAIEVEALCRLHDPGVAAKLAAFDARWPDSAQRSRLTSSSCP